MRGVILDRDGTSCVRLNVFLPIIKDVIRSYNWLLTDIDSSYSSEILRTSYYDFLSGDEFLKLIEDPKHVFVWGVFSAIPLGVRIKTVLNSELPYANGYGGFWKNNITIRI